MPTNQTIMALCVLCLILSFNFLSSECHAAGGLKFITAFPSADITTNPQNWSGLQNKQGLIFIGNNGFLLEYDGVEWRKHKIPNGTVRSMAMTPDGTIYIGGYNCFGQMAPDSLGALNFASLAHLLPSAKRRIGDVNHTNAIGDTVYFTSGSMIIRYHQGRVRTWESNRLFGRSFACNDELYVDLVNSGLNKLVGDSLQLLPGSEYFADTRVKMLTSYDPARESLLVGTQDSGIFLYEHGKLINFSTDVDDYIRVNHLQAGLRLTSGNFALATLTGGINIVDRFGRHIQTYTYQSGLCDNRTLSLFEDFSGNLWAVQNSGISRIELSSPFTEYLTDVNETGYGLSIHRSKADDSLYVGTTKGLFRPQNDGRFIETPMPESYCWSITSDDSSLFAAFTDGLFQMRGGSVNRLSDAPGYELCLTKVNPGQLWVGTRNGIARYNQDETGRWRLDRVFDEINVTITEITEDTFGRLWLGSRSSEMFNITLNRDLADPVITPYLPPQEQIGIQIHPICVSGKMLFGSTRGLFKFCDDSDSLIAANIIENPPVGKDMPIFRVMEDHQGDLWFSSRRWVIRGEKKPNGQYVLQHNPFRRLTREVCTALYQDPLDRSCWFSCLSGIINYNPRQWKDCEIDFTCLIRMVESIGSQERLYDGSRGVGPFSDPDNQLRLPYGKRNLRFTFAAPFFESEERTKYRYILEGYDEDWSEWDSETIVDYPALPFGSYKFRVKAKNVYEHESSEDTFSIKILPPIYLTAWAITGYICVLVLLMVLSARLWATRLIRQKRKLEQIVMDRTREIGEKNTELESKAYQLQKQSEALKELDKAKTRFFDNVTHEFRTPLTLIMGPLEQLYTSSRDKNRMNLIEMMLRNCKRLLELINQLLQASRLESSKEQLRASKMDLIPVVKCMVEPFDYWADRKNLTLLFSSDQEQTEVFADHDKLQTILYNLLSNAFKYTPAGGKVCVNVSETEEVLIDCPVQVVRIEVSDTGPGIPEKEMANVFDRFQQVLEEQKTKHVGSGLGLWLTKNLVELHHGKIEVSSRCGGDGDSSGSIFTVWLPLGHEHLNSLEIVESLDPASLSLSRDLQNALDQEMKTDIDGEEEDEEPKREAEIEQTESDKASILVVEDNKDMREYVRSILATGYDVVDAADGAEGIKIAQDLLPDLIVSDVMMPIADGYELCSTLKTDPATSHIPIILLTAKTSPVSQVQGYAEGANAYVTKPFVAGVLLAQVESLLAWRSIIRQQRVMELSLAEEQRVVPPADAQFYEDLISNIENNLGEQHLNVDFLQKEMAMGRATFYRKVAAVVGLSPGKLIMRMRLRESKRLLDAGWDKITDVAFEVGFSDTAYFAKCFKERFEQTPTEYKSTHCAEAKLSTELLDDLKDSPN